MVPALLTVLLLSMVTAATGADEVPPALGLIEPPELIVTLPAVDVASGVVVALETGVSA